MFRSMDCEKTRWPKCTSGGRAAWRRSGPPLSRCGDGLSTQEVVYPQVGGLGAAVRGAVDGPPHGCEISTEIGGQLQAVARGGS